MITSGLSELNILRLTTLMIFGLLSVTWRVAALTRRRALALQPVPCTLL